MEEGEDASEDGSEAEDEDDATLKDIYGSDT